MPKPDLPLDELKVLVAMFILEEIDGSRPNTEEKILDKIISTGMVYMDERELDEFRRKIVEQVLNQKDN